MNRFNWSWVLGLAAAVGLLTCQNVAWAEDYADGSPFSLASSPSTTAPSAVQNPCATCCESACDGCSDRHWIVSAEGVFLSRQRNQRVATFDVLDGAGNSVESFSAGELGDGLVITPRVTVGIQGECWGIQMRYWRMNEPGCDKDILPLYEAGAIAENSFKAETLDLEITRLFCVGETQLQGSFGVRYGQLEQCSLLNVFDTVGNTDLSGLALARYGFHGAGITGGVTALRPVGCKNFNLFCRARASMLWDSKATNEADVRSTAAVDNGGWASSTDGAISESAANLFIAEIQLGGQWMLPLKCIPANAFVRGALEYQYWGTNNSGGAEAVGLTGPLGGPYGVAYAQSSEAYISLVGFSVGTGLTW